MDIPEDTFRAQSGYRGKFGVTKSWGMDTGIATDMVTVFGFIARVHSSPDRPGYSGQFGTVVGEWRPELLA